MATADAHMGEMDAFYRYLSIHKESNWKQLTPEESVREFREQQHLMRRLIAEMQPAIEQSRRGESNPLDAEQLIEEVTQQLANEGITE